jgi:hypothetical protein
MIRTAAGQTQNRDAFRRDPLPQAAWLLAAPAIVCLARGKLCRPERDRPAARARQADRGAGGDPGDRLMGQLRFHRI